MTRPALHRRHLAATLAASASTLLCGSATSANAQTATPSVPKEVRLGWQKGSAIADFLHKVEVLPGAFDTRKVIDTSFSAALNP